MTKKKRLSRMPSDERHRSGEVSQRDESATAVSRLPSDERHRSGEVNAQRRCRESQATSNIVVGRQASSGGVEKAKRRAALWLGGKRAAAVSRMPSDEQHRSCEVSEQRRCRECQATSSIVVARQASSGGVEKAKRRAALWLGGKRAAAVSRLPSDEQHRSCEVGQRGESAAAVSKKPSDERHRSWEVSEQRRCRDCQATSGVNGW
jgi:hypothetical protein